MRNFAVVVAIAIAIPVAAYVLILTSSPLPISVIDRDQSGIVSIGEALDAIDIDKRQSKSSPSCTEYFWLKDGLTAYERCPSSGNGR
jgi:hypothetical protein